MSDLIDLNTKKPNIFERPISEKLEELAKIDLDDTLLNQFLNKSREYRKAFDTGCHPQKLAAIVTDLKNLEGQINKSLDSNHLDAKFRARPLPRPREPIHRLPHRGIFNTWRGNKVDTLPSPSLRWNGTTSKNRTEPEFKESNQKPGFGFTSTPLGENKVPDLKNPGLNLSEIAEITENSQSQQLVTSIPHLLQGEDLKQEKVTEYLEDPENVKELTKLRDQGFNIYNLFEYARDKIKNLRFEPVYSEEHQGVVPDSLAKKNLNKLPL
ncbi:hypothetical protein QAD02_008200 [Eretmocerus hayati]|uniref:Uncharacterized protein n=1 Tax=Eretmocerus hayati TaxID=131215 RepID=A0ACC2N6E7_9HYME|nr:hypothetical protein QAD02_008200 [Eretmocerus hayati]